MIVRAPRVRHDQHVTGLLAVGIAVVAFGAVVLLKFPQRPGGRIAWHGFEVSSVGAGLPLIVVGIAAVAVAAVRGDGGAGSGSAPPVQASPPSIAGPGSGGAA